MTLKPQRILWPTDFSPLALVGARYARGVAEQFGAELHVIHVVPPPLTADLAAGLPAEGPVVFADPELVDACRQRLADVVREQLGGRPVVQEVLLGSAWSAICKYASQHEIDLVVIATHGRTGIQHAVVGSTAERVVQHAPCPVLVVKSRQREFVTD
jgi:nucleotide-binding universal stress UspA family protein